MTKARKRKAVPGLIEPSAKTPFFSFDFVVDRERFCGSTGTKNRGEAVRIIRGKRHEAGAAAAVRRLSVARHDMNWEQAAECYFTDKGEYSHQRTDRRRAQWVTEQLGEGRFVSEITDKDIASLVTKARSLKRWGIKSQRTLSASSVNLSIEIVRRVLRHVKYNHEVHLPREPRFGRHFLEVKPRVREMMIAEEIRLEPIRPDLWPVAQFILITGLRREAAFIRWSQVHWSEGVIHVTSKGGKFQEVPITPEVEVLLREAWGKNDEFVWTWQAKRDQRHRTTKKKFIKGEYYPLTSNCFEVAWSRMRVKAKVDDLRIHDIRKTTGARMVRATGDLLAASRRLAHANVAMTAKHYTHITRDDERVRMIEVSEATRKWRERHLALAKAE
jgi:integrase